MINNIVSVLFKIFRRNKKKGPFEVGDRVQCLFGNFGKIKSISTNGMFLNVEFPDAPSAVVVRRDGRMFGWAKKPFIKKL